MLDLNYIIKNGGATLTPQGNKSRLKKGYMVSYQDYETIIPIGELSNTIIEDYIKLAKKHNAYCGIWVDNEMVYLDISIRIKDLQKALAFAKSQNQLAIFRLDDFQVITL